MNRVRERWESKRQGREKETEEGERERGGGARQK